MFCFKKLYCEPSDWCFKILDKIFSVDYYLFCFCFMFLVLFYIRNVMFFFKKLHCEPSEWCLKILGKIFMLVIILSF